MEIPFGSMRTGACGDSLGQNWIGVELGDCGKGGDVGTWVRKLAEVPAIKRSSHSGLSCSYGRLHTKRNVVCSLQTVQDSVTCH